MKLKVLLKEKKNLSEETNPSLAKLRAASKHLSNTEKNIKASFEANKNNLPRFFATLQKSLSVLGSDMKAYIQIFPFLEPLMRTLSSIIVINKENAQYFGSIEEASARSRGFSSAARSYNTSNIRRQPNLDSMLQNYSKKIEGAIDILSKKQKKDPIDFFIEQKAIASHLRSIYQILYLTSEINKTFIKMNQDISGKTGISLLKQLKDNPESADILTKRFESEFTKMNISGILDKSREDFNNFFLTRMFMSSDIATGGEYSKRKTDVTSAAAWAKSQPLEEGIKNEINNILAANYTKLIKESNNLLYIHPITYDLLKRLTIKYKNEIDYTIKVLNENTLNINKYNLIVSQIQDLVKNYSKKDKKKLKNFNENKNLRVNSKLGPETIQFILSTCRRGHQRKLLKEECTIKNHSDRDMSRLENILTQFYPYAQKKLKFEKPVSINLVSDEENSKDPFGKTAYYNPETMEISIFVDDRHPKDMLRSIAHELVHHSQNCKGEFDNVKATEPGYAQKDPHLRQLEGEAYLLGNGFLVRDFEDMLKNLKEN